MRLVYGGRYCYLKIKFRFNENERRQSSISDILLNAISNSTEKEFCFWLELRSSRGQTWLATTSYDVKDMGTWTLDLLEPTPGVST